MSAWRDTLVLVLIFLMAGCAPQCSRNARVERTKPNAILIVLDTVRADHLSAYGYTRPTTPTLERFARTATRYTGAMANAAWTLPSHASMFTGKLPFEHKAHFRHVKKRGNETPYDGAFVTLAETFKEMGYATGGIIANNAYLSRRWGLWRGFDTYYVKRQWVKPHTDDAIDWLKEHQHEPFFLFINYMDAHGPYEPIPRPDVIGYEASTSDRALRKLRNHVLPGKPAPPEIQKQAIDAYDTALANLDGGLAPFFQWLDTAGLAEDTLIVVTSDHGDFFGEHQLAGHPRDVYQGTIHVPLIVKNPGEERGRVDSGVIMLHQLPHLMLSALGTPEALSLASRFPGQSQTVAALAEQYWERGDDMLANRRWGHRFDRIRRAWFDWPHKLIHSSDGQHELYDLARDPGEENNLFEGEPEVATRLIDHVKRVVGNRLVPATDDTKPIDFSEQEIEQLKALGYID